MFKKEREVDRIKTMNFFLQKTMKQTIAELPEGSVFGPREGWVYFKMFGNGEKGNWSECRASLSFMEELTGYSRKVVIRALRNLQAAGLIQKRSGSDKKGSVYDVWHVMKDLNEA